MEAAGPPDAPSDAPADGSSDRRAFLRRAGIGAGVAGAVWAAPSILTLDSAYAVGSCPSGSTTFAWSTATNNTLANTAAKVGTTTTAGIDIRIISTAQTGVAGSGLIFNNWRTRSGTGSQVTCGTQVDYPMGNIGSFYSLEMAADTTNCTAGTGTINRNVEVVFGFFDAGTTTPHAVRNLAFSLLDVDVGSASTYTDQVQIFLNGSATAASTGAAAANNFATPGLGANVSQPTAGSARFVGTANTANTSPASNVSLVSKPSIDITKVRVLFTDISARPTSIQWVGISDLTFCKV